MQSIEISASPCYNYIEIYIFRSIELIKAIQIQHDGQMEDALRLVKEAGFEHVSIGFGSSRVFHGDGWEDEMLRIRAILDGLGLRCALTHLPYHNLTVSSEISDFEMDEAIKRAIRATAILGADRTVMHTRTNYPAKATVDKAQSLKDNISLIKSLLPTAREAGIILAIENLPKFERYPLYPHTTEDLLELFCEINDPMLGICWDFGHGLMTDLDQEESLRKIGKNLKATHIHDNFKNDDQHLIPGIGICNWKSVMPILKEIGYEGPFMLELVYPDDSTLSAFLKHSFASIERLQDLMEGKI